MNFNTNKRHRVFHKVGRHGSKLTFDKTYIDNFPARVFLYFPQKMDLGFLGTKRKIGDELEVLKTRKMILVGLLAFPVTK